MGLLQWAQDKISSIYHGGQAIIQAVADTYNNVRTNKLASLKMSAVTTYQSVIETYRIVRSYLKIQENRDAIAENSLQFMQGVKRILDPTVLIYFLTYARPKTFHSFLWAQLEVASRFSQALLYYVGIKPMVRNAVRATTGVVTNNAMATEVADALTTYFIDLAAFIYLMRNANSALLADNTCRGLSLAIKSGEESAVLNPSDNPLIKSCQHSGFEQFTAGITSSSNYLLNYLLIYLMRMCLPRPLSIFPEALFVGRSLLEYPLAAAGNCTEHRAEVLNKNNPYALGYGMVNVGINFASREAIYWATGAERNFFIDEAIATGISFYFIVLTILGRKQPLPGTEVGPDYFKHSRGFVSMLNEKLQRNFNESYKLVKAKAKEAKDEDRDDWLQVVIDDFHAAWNMPVFKFARGVLLQPDLQNKYTLANRPSVREYLQLMSPTIVEKLKKAKEMRDDTTLVVLNKCKWIFPEYEKEQRAALGVLLAKKVDRHLDNGIRFFSNPFEDPAEVAKVKAEEKRKTDEEKKLTYDGMDANDHNDCFVENKQQVQVLPPTQKPRGMNSSGASPAATNVYALIPPPKKADTKKVDIRTGSINITYDNMDDSDDSDGDDELNVLGTRPVSKDFG